MKSNIVQLRTLSNSLYLYKKYCTCNCWPNWVPLYLLLIQLRLCFRQLHEAMARQWLHSAVKQLLLLFIFQYLIIHMHFGKHVCQQSFLIQYIYESLSFCSKPDNTVPLAQPQEWMPMQNQRPHFSFSSQHFFSQHLTFHNKFTYPPYVLMPLLVGYKHIDMFCHVH